MLVLHEVMPKLLFLELTCAGSESPLLVLAGGAYRMQEFWIPWACLEQPVHCS